MDCVANTKICKEFGVSGYPTLKIFKNGDFAKEYDGPRDTGETLLSVQTDFFTVFWLNWCTVLCFGYTGVQCCVLVKLMYCVVFLLNWCALLCFGLTCVQYCVLVKLVYSIVFWLN